MEQDRPTSSSTRRPGASGADPKSADCTTPPPGIRTLPEDGRDAAIRHLARLAAKYPDLTPEPVRTEGLDPRESALAHMIVDHAIRRWTTIEHLVRVSAMREPAELEPRIRAALLSGAVQLLFLDRIPDHAAIDRTVEWAKTQVRPGAAGITNAVLRRIAGVRASDGDRTRVLRERWSDRRDELPLASGASLALLGDALPSESVDRWSVASGMPRTLVSRWAEQWGESVARDLAMHGLAPAPTVLNVCHAKGPLDSKVYGSHRQSGFRVYSGDRAHLAKLLEARSDLWVQDSASAEALMAVSKLPLSRIVDVCAGRGTKTRQMLKTFPSASIIASDTDPARLTELRRGLGGIERASVVEARSLAEACAGRADMALLDVPCSNTGVLARRPEARHRFGPEQTDRLLGIQRSIIELAIELVRPGGWILYSTCSLEPEEDEQMVERAVARFGLRIEGTSRTLPEGQPGDAASDYRDGSFWALLGRP